MNDGRTHSDECWRWHPDCAEARMQELAQLREEVERLREMVRTQARERLVDDLCGDDSAGWPPRGER